jgi:hypothetical protein
MTEFKKLKEGDILGEAQYYKVDKISGNKIQLTPDSGDPIVVTKEYVETFIQSGDQYVAEEKLTKTQLAELFIAKSRLPMTVAFLKANTNKTKKVYKAELATQAEKVRQNFMDNGISAIEEALASPVLDYIPGELRVMRGRHYGDIEEATGRIQFTDMEVTTGHNQRQVDPRTIQHVIVDNVKYIIKK